VTDYAVHVFQQLEPVRLIRHQHPVCADTRRTIAAFLERDRVWRLVAAAFDVPLSHLVPVVKVSPGR
jgi:hypothetical protein